MRVSVCFADCAGLAVFRNQLPRQQKPLQQGTSISTASFLPDVFPLLPPEPVEAGVAERKEAARSAAVEQQPAVRGLVQWNYGALARAAARVSA